MVKEKTVLFYHWIFFCVKEFANALNKGQVVIRAELG